MAAAPHPSARRVWLAFAFVLAIGTGCEGGEAAPEDAGGEDAGGEDAGGEDAGGGAPDAAPPASGPLINNALWRVLDPAEDPFMEIPMPLCPPGSAFDEMLGGELVYAVRTERCPSLTARQASRRAVQAGDTLAVRVYHFPLTAPEDATAQLVLQLGEREIFRRALPIPSEASELSETFVAEEDFARGTPVLFHVENHGENEYVLIAIDVSR